jgi:hypothetical protein
MIVDGIAAGLRDTGTEPDPRQILDVLWLATLMPAQQKQRWRRDGRTGDVPATAGSGHSAESSKDRRREPDTPTPSVPSTLTPPAGITATQPINQLDLEPIAGIVATAHRVTPTLDDPLGVGRSLRPLRVRRPAPTKTSLDEVATAEQFARLRYWLPVLRSSAVRWPDLALVVDAATALWAGRVQRFELVLQRLGAFRQLRTWRLRPDPPGGGPPVVAPGLDGRDGPELDAALLGEPTGRRLLLVVTDGTSPHWNGAYRPLLARWAETNPVGVVSLVPPRLWPDGGLRAMAGEVRAAYPLQPNTRWDRCSHRFGKGPTLAVPVADLHPRRLSQFAAAFGGTQHRTRTLLLDVESPPVTPVSPRSPAEAVSMARARLRPRAFDLLVHLSTAPLVFGPLLDRVRQLTGPDTTHDELAEVLSCGLVEPVPVAGTGGHPEVVGYRFIDPKMRAELSFRLHPALRTQLRWELFIHAQDQLGADRQAARQLLDNPDDVVRGSAILSRPTRLMMIISTTPARRDARVRELAMRWTGQGWLGTPRVENIDATRFATGSLRFAEVLAGAQDRVLSLDHPEVLRDKVNPRCRETMRALLNLDARDGQALVTLCGSAGQIKALLREYPALGSRAHQETLPRSPADDAYLILWGLLHGGGHSWSRHTALDAWTRVCRRYDADPGRFASDPVARDMYRELIAKWRDRAGGGAPVVEPQDLLSIEVKVR